MNSAHEAPWSELLPPSPWPLSRSEKQWELRRSLWQGRAARSESCSPGCRRGFPGVRIPRHPPAQRSAGGTKPVGGRRPAWLWLPSRSGRTPSELPARRPGEGGCCLGLAGLTLPEAWASGGPACPLFLRGLFRVVTDTWPVGQLCSPKPLHPRPGSPASTPGAGAIPQPPHGAPSQ